MLYSVPVLVRLTGALDVAALERSLGTIVQRHDALRTTFAEVEGTLVQVVTPFAAFTLPVEVVAGDGSAARDAAMHQRLDQETARTFDLAVGPLFRSLLFMLGTEEHVLLLVAHHIVIDRLSLGILFRELASLYSSASKGELRSPEPLPLQYGDYAVWQRAQLGQAAVTEHIEWWRAQLASAMDVLPLPTDFPRPAMQTHRGARLQACVAGDVLDVAQALARRERATLYMVLLAAVQVVLAKWSHTTDVVVGSPITGRTRRELEPLIGFFVNMLALRTDLSGNPTFREVVRRVRETTLDAYEHQDVPFEQIVAELRPTHRAGHTPFFQVLFDLEEAGETWGSPPGLRIERMEGGIDVARFDIMLRMAVRPRGLIVRATYNTDLFEVTTAERLLVRWERVLRMGVADPDQRLMEVGCL